MARLARLLREAAVMRVAVAIRTFAERQTCVARFVIGAGRVALCTSHRRMQSGQRKARLTVIELSGLPPIIVRVALQAILAQASGMRVLVTRRAGLR